MKTRSLILPLILLLLLPACTIKPSIKSGETIITLGGSIGSKTAGETSSYSGPLGTLSYSTVSNDETIIPAKAINSYTTIGVGKQLLGGLRTTESTKRVLSSHDVSKHATTKAAEVETTKILNPVEEAIPAVTPTPAAQ